MTIVAPVVVRHLMTGVWVGRLPMSLVCYVVHFEVQSSIGAVPFFQESSDRSTV
jgi:hypothetical protein